MQTLSYSIFVVQIGIVLHDSSRNLQKNNLTCPDPNEWSARQEEFKCDNEGKVYICILNKQFQPTELCVYDDFVYNGTAGCPFISIREGSPEEVIISHPDSFHSCDENLPGCPPKYHGGYKLSEIYKYEACTKGIGQLTRSADSTSTDSHSKSSTTIANIIIGYNTEDSTTFISIIVCAFLWKIVFVVTAVLTYKKRDCISKCRSENLSRFETRTNENSDTLLPTIEEEDDCTTEKRPKEIFNELNGYLKRCDYKMFEKRYADCLAEFSTSNIKLVCDLDFLKIHSDIYQGKYSVFNKEFEDMMTRCHCLRNRLRYVHEVSLLSAKARLFVHTGDHAKLKQTIHVILKKTEEDKRLSGKQIIGWVYFDYSRYYQQMIILSLREGKIDKAETYLVDAINNIDISIQHFSDDHCSDDAKRGKGIALLVKITLKLRWFGMDKRLDRFMPQPKDIEDCSSLFIDFKYLDIPTENDIELKLQLLKTKTIFAYRAGLKNNMKEKVHKLDIAIEKYNRNGMTFELKVMKHVMLEEQ